MFKKVEKDKWKHFYVGIIMGAVLQGCLLFLLPGNFFVTIVIALLLVVVISYGFELFSLFTGLGHYDIYDAIAGIIGGILGMIPVVLIAYF